TFPPNGLPVFNLNYRNDDGGPGYGKDSRLFFDPPADGEYTVRIGDSPNHGGPNYGYRPTLRPPPPAVPVSLRPPVPSVWEGRTARDWRHGEPHRRLRRAGAGEAGESARGIRGPGHIRRGGPAVNQFRPVRVADGRESARDCGPAQARGPGNHRRQGSRSRGDWRCAEGSPAWRPGDGYLRERGRGSPGCGGAPQGADRAAERVQGSGAARRPRVAARSPRVGYRAQRHPDHRTGHGAGSRDLRGAVGEAHGAPVRRPVAAGGEELGARGEECV